MANEALAPLGPDFGPNHMVVTASGGTDQQFGLEVYPDANNPLLRANGLQARFYLYRNGYIWRRSSRHLLILTLQ